MFRTNEVNRAKEFSLFYGAETKIWRAISLEMRAPYFFVSHAQKDGTQWLHETSLLWRHDDVANFCREVNKDPMKKITQLAVLIPDNEKMCWRMEHVSEVWSIANAETLQPLILIGEDGGEITKPGRLGTSVPNSVERIYCNWPTHERGGHVTSRASDFVEFIEA